MEMEPRPACRHSWSKPTPCPYCTIDLLFKEVFGKMPDVPQEILDAIKQGSDADDPDPGPPSFMAPTTRNMREAVGLPEPGVGKPIPHGIHRKLWVLNVVRDPGDIVSCIVMDDQHPPLLTDEQQRQLAKRIIRDFHVRDADNPMAWEFVCGLPPDKSIEKGWWTS